MKNNLSRVIEELPKTGAVLITKNGRARAVLFPVDEDTDLESLLLSQSKRLWELIDRGILSGTREGLTSFGDLPD
ncbi:MAG: type II toxin-antitoxin system Phd/YefM family antitoxin [Acidobacteriota bacterium]